jgi:hypothetical protein
LLVVVGRRIVVAIPGIPGPAHSGTLQHGCEFVKGVILEARGGGHANAKTGERSECISMPGSGRGQASGEYICDKYYMREPKGAVATGPTMRAKR